MKLAKAVKEIEKINSKIEDYPYHVWTAFFSQKCKPSVVGNQISMGDETDYKSPEEIKAALEYLVKQFDGEVIWEA